MVNEIQLLHMHQLQSAHLTIARPTPPDGNARLSFHFSITNKTPYPSPTFQKKA
jgi:hypothetical protein